MVMGVLAAVAVVAFALVVAGIDSVRTQPLGRVTPRSPLDEAERILASRYARRLITAEEYDRMTAVLRR